MTNEQILIFLTDEEACQLLERTLSDSGYQITKVKDRNTFQTLYKAKPPGLIILGESLSGKIGNAHPDNDQRFSGLELVDNLRESHPTLPIILLAEEQPESLAIDALRLGVADILYPPLLPSDILQAIRDAYQRHQRIEKWARLTFKQKSNTLGKRLSDAEIEQSKLSSIITKIEDGVIIVDTDGCLMLINQSAREAFELDEGNLIGKPIKDAIHSNELIEIFNVERLTTPYRTEISLPDGRVLNAHFTPIPEIGLAVTMQDITHLKELDQIKNEFVSMVSHDLRSPLTAILGYVELIERVGPVTEEQRNFIRRVETGVYSITALIDELLDLGRIEAGLDDRKEPIPLDTVIRSTVESLRQRAKRKAQKIAIEIQEDLPKVLGNPIRLRQMLSNLIANAIKYSPKDGIVGVHTQVENGQIIIQVIDNGVGIPLKDQPHIFDKFYRTSNLPDDTSGTGLSLAIVKSIVENHGGRIWVESTPGEGTTFFVVLPALG